MTIIPALSASIYGMTPLPGIPGLSALFNEHDVVFSTNGKIHPVDIGGLRLPLEPIVEIRMERNWVLSDVVGSASNEKISGTQVKENMGRGDALITISGFLLTSGPTLTQSLGFEASENASVNQNWADSLKKIRSLFDEECSLEIKDWLPQKSPSFGPVPPSQARIRDDGFSVFESLGIKWVVLRSFNLFEREGQERRGYVMRLQEDRSITLEDLTPTEEAEE